MTTSLAGARRPSHLVHDELGTPAEMAADCEELGRNLGLESLGGSLAGSSVESRLESRVEAELPSRRDSRLERAAQAAAATPPSIHYADYPAEVGKREIRVSDAAARIANALHLHLD